MKGTTKYYKGPEIKDKHTDNMCDKCGKEVGKKNLVKVPFLYCNVNDKHHDDLSFLVGAPAGSGYRQYYICLPCSKKEAKHLNSLSILCSKWVMFNVRKRIKSFRI